MIESVPSSVRVGSRVRRPASVVSTGLLVALVVVALLPFAFMIITSLQDVSRLSLSFDPGAVDLSNYTRLFTDFGFGRALLNSIVVVTIACALNVVVSSMAAYAFEKHRFAGSEYIFWVYIATMMVPGQVTLIPLFTIMRDLGLLNSYIALALPVVNAFGVFLIRQFLKGVPDEMLEAARVDGAREMRIFRTIIVPTIWPIIVSLIVFTFLTTWNDFLWPLVSVTSSDMETVTLAAAKLQGKFTTNFGLVMAGATVSFAVPFALYVALQRQFVEGITSSSVKG